MVKNLPPMQKTQVRSLGQEDPLEKGIATHFKFLPGEFHGQRNLAGYSPWDHKEWVAIPFSRVIFLTQGSNQVSCIGGRFFTIWATREAPRFHIYTLIYDSYFFLSDLPHSVWQTLGPSTSLWMIQFCSFLWLSNIPLYICATFFFHSSADGHVFTFFNCDKI